MPAIGVVLALIDWKKILGSLSEKVSREGGEALLRRLQPAEHQKAARAALELFVEEWYQEVEDKTPLSCSLAGYKDQLERLLEAASSEISEWMEPEVKEVDFGSLQRIWDALNLDPLPEGFSWPLVAQNYARAIRRYIKRDPEMRAALSLALQERMTEATERSANAAERSAGLAPSFNVEGYRRFLIEKKCNALQLAVMHSSTYNFDRRITLWSVFVAQSARESPPILQIPHEIERRLRDEGQLISAIDEEEWMMRLTRYRAQAVRPILSILERKRHVVVVGDPGAGKTSLIKYKALLWAKEDIGPMPLIIDLKEYVTEHMGLLEYCGSGRASFHLDIRALEKELNAGRAAFYLDGLDEIFDAVLRRRVVSEIAVISARYPDARIIVTSRKVGYEPEVLGQAGFSHATLEDFDIPQSSEFLRQWHKIAEDDEGERARLQERMERALLDSAAIRELAGNPLLLTMMAILNRNQELPRNRVALYREASRVLLDDWDARKALPVGEFDREDKEALLRELAGDFQQAKEGLAGNLIERTRLVQHIQSFLHGIGIQDSRMKAKGIVKELTERNFILSFAGAERFSFVHRTFLEFYCAAWFVERFEKKQNMTLEQLKVEVFAEHWRDEKWHEVLRLIVGMLEERKAEELVLFLMEEKRSDSPLIRLLLAAGCFNEVRNRRTIGGTGQLLLRKLEYEIFRHILTNDKRDFDAELRVSKSRSSGIKLIALVWREEGAQELLVKAVSDHYDPTVRRSAFEELIRGWKNNSDVLALLNHGARYDVDLAMRQVAVDALIRDWKNEPGTLALLQDCARNDSEYTLRQAVIEALARDWKDDQSVLALLETAATSDTSANVRATAVAGVGHLPGAGSDILELLRDRAQSDDVYIVRLSAIEALTSQWKGDPDTVVLLRHSALTDEFESVRKVALEKLAAGWKSDPEILTLVKDRARFDKSQYVRDSALELMKISWSDDPDTVAMTIGG